MAETCVAGDAGAGVRRGSSGDSAPVPQPRLWAGRPLPRPSAQAPAPSRPCPQDNEAFHSQTKGKSLKGESSVSTRAKGLGWGRTGLPESHWGCSDELVWIYSCLTQHNLIFHIKDQIIFQLQLITHPQKHIKGRSASAQHLLCSAACARISRPASRRLGPRNSAVHAHMGL